MGTGKEKFDILLLIARPAAGKSEIISYLKKIDAAVRVEKFHIGELDEIDDFPMLWAWLEEDSILTEMEKPRLHTTTNGYFKEPHLWDLLIRRICLEYRKRINTDSGYYDRFTTLIEFSRGSEHGGYARAFSRLTPEVYERSALVYVDVSYDESLRKNRRRYNPERPYSILEHGLPDEKMERLYREIDWEAVSAPDPEYINIQGHRVPYAVFDNTDDITTAQGEALGSRLEQALGRLWQIYRLGRC